MTCCCRPMPESDRSSWMSSRRHGAPLIWYSDSPVRNSVRVIVTSENSIGSRPALLSIVSDTSARPSAGRCAVPAKMTSSILAPRRLRAPWAPSTHATESTTFDFPEPFGPTTTVTPGSNSSVVRSANDLKPLRVNDFRNTRAPSTSSSERSDGIGRPRGPVQRCRSRDREPRLAGRLLVVDRDDVGARRSVVTPPHHRVDRVTCALERGFDRAVGPVADPARHTEITRHATTRVAEEDALHATVHDHVPPHDLIVHRSHLASLAEERRTAADALAHERAPAATARLALACVHVVMELVLARLAEHVDVLRVRERRPAVLHRLLQHLDHRAVEPPDLLLGERVGHAVPPQAGLAEDLVAVDVADPGKEGLVHQRGLQLRVALRDELTELGPRDVALERVETEVCELLDLVLDAVERRHEHLAERSRVDEAQLPALRERDDDVRVLRKGLLRGLRAQQLTGHAEVRDEHVAALEPHQQVLAAPVHAGDAHALEARHELLAVLVPPDRAHALHLDGLDPLAAHLAFEVAPDDLDLRQLRHPTLLRVPCPQRPPVRPPSRTRPARTATATRLLPRPARPASSNALRPFRAPRRRASPSRRSASRGRARGRRPGSAAGGRTGVPRAPGDGSCSRARRVRRRPARSVRRGAGARARSRRTSRRRGRRPR